MRKLLFPTMACVAFIILSFTNAYTAEDDLSGFTIRQLSAAITKSGLGTQKLYSILTFDSEERDGANLAVLSGSRSGWHVIVLHRVSGGLRAQWLSGNLTNDFAVSSSSSLEIDDVGDEQVVEFSGCAAHQCGLLDGVLGLLLYSPKSKQVYFAHYRYDEKKPLGSFGSIEFSKNADAPGNERYKSALQKAMSKILRHEVESSAGH